jgi:hypothetical protein
MLAAYVSHLLRLVSQTYYAFPRIPIIMPGACFLDMRRRLGEEKEGKESQNKG